MMKGDEMIQIPTDFLSRLREPLDWVDLRFAYDRQIVGAKTLIDQACKVLSETDSNDEALLSVASANESDRLEPWLNQLAPLNGGKSEQDHKWALILAAFISESDIADKLAAVEEVYSSFDYPEELAEFVRYMPMKGPDLGSKQANEERMLASLREFSAQVVVPSSGAATNNVREGER
jgi:hypothetical protein